MDDCLKIVVSGEVDAGKSSLIGSFLHASGAVTDEAIREIEQTCRRLGRDTEFAYLLDSFEEERVGQLTIDTTRTVCRNGKGPAFLFIDVPGHAELLKNMLTGSSDADAALLVIDIRKVIEEGTRRHIRALDFLGVRRITVVLNKLDSVDYSEKDFRRAQKLVADYFHRSGLRCGPAIPVSARRGDNLVRRSPAMAWYRGKTLRQALTALRPAHAAKAGKDFCFPVQDVYRIDGTQVCVGSVASGSVHPDARVMIAPSGRQAKVGRLRVFGARPSEAAAPDPVGLELSCEVRRGDVVYTGRAPETGKRIRARIFCVRPMKAGESVTLQCATQSVPAGITRVSRVLESGTCARDGIAEGAAGEVVIRTGLPLVTRKYAQASQLGRFVLKDDAGICAAGIVI